MGAGQSGGGHTILSGLLECVSVDLKERGSVVGLKPKPKFMGLFQFMGAKSKTPMRLENNSSEPDEGSELLFSRRIGVFDLAPIN